MRVEIIAIGDELTSGQRLDTNSQWLSRQLGDIGLRAAFHTTVGDDLEDNLAAFRVAVSRSDVILVTGGLGPTADDLTREVLSRLSDQPLELQEDQLDRIVGLFASRGREMPERNRVQAMFPRGSRAIANPHGTAPGIDLRLQDANQLSRIFALPGVPAEMHEMWEESVRPAVLEMRGDEVTVMEHHSLRCFGLGESEIERRLGDLIQRGRQPLVGITASKATITLRISATAASQEECRRMIAATESEIRDALGTLVFGAGEEELQDVLVRQLAQRGLTIGIIESATRGLVSQWIGQAKDASQVYLGGLVVDARTPRWDRALRTLSDRPDTVDDLRPIAGQVREYFGADIGLVVGPLKTGAGDRPELESIDFAFEDAVGSFQGNHPTAGHPEIHLPRAAKQALDLIRRRLMSEHSQPT